MDAQYLKDAVAGYFTKKMMCCHFEMGLNTRGRLRADVLALSMKGYLVVVETKSSATDYLQDKKWHLYKEYAHKFYLAMSQATFDKVKTRIPSGTGVMVIEPCVKAGGVLRKPKVRVVKSSPSVDVDLDKVFNLAIRMAFRSSDKNRRKIKNVRTQ